MWVFVCGCVGVCLCEVCNGVCYLVSLLNLERESLRERESQS